MEGLIAKESATCRVAKRAPTTPLNERATRGTAMLSVEASDDWHGRRRRRTRGTAAVLTELGEPPDGDVIAPPSRVWPAATAMCGSRCSASSPGIPARRQRTGSSAGCAIRSAVSVKSPPRAPERSLAMQMSEARLRSVLETDPDARVRRSAFGALAGALAPALRAGPDVLGSARHVARRVRRAA